MGKRRRELPRGGARVAEQNQGSGAVRCRAGCCSVWWLGGVSLHVPLCDWGGCGLFHLLFQRAAIASQLRSGGLDGRARGFHRANGAVWATSLLVAWATSLLVAMLGGAGRRVVSPPGSGSCSWRGLAWRTVRARAVHAGARSTIMHHSGCIRHASPRHSRCASCVKHLTIAEGPKRFGSALRPQVATWTPCT